MARPKIRTSTPRRRPAGKPASLPSSVANAVIERLFTTAGSGRDDVIVTAGAKRKPGAKRRPGALSHPAARGKAPGQRPSLAAAVASAVTGRLSASAPPRKAKPRASLAAAVASAVSRQLAGRAAARRR